MRLRARHIERFWDRLNAALWCAVGMALMGCSANAWTLTHAEVPFTRVLDVDWPGGRNLYGYANRETGEVQVKRGLREIERDCIIKHEKKHLRGYSHPDRRGFVTDCGDGTMVGRQP